jgi:aspartate racemase
MKLVGLVGGVSWVSTLDYYKAINEGINKKLGGLNFVECIIYSLNFEDVQHKTWEGAYDLLLNACLRLKQAGASGIAICANTGHLYADKLEMEVQLPLIHIGTATANDVKRKGIKKVGLIGTKYTMELDFYKAKLKASGLEVLTPDTQKKERLHSTHCQRRVRKRYCRCCY